AEAPAFRLGRFHFYLPLRTLLFLQILNGDRSQIYIRQLIAHRLWAAKESNLIYGKGFNLNNF
ncbi:MAG: hypothetical protein KGQ83_09585, partial [Planctomycetes bacterium]|nr:hypothetical protein [Planctomycetota bacterium]